MMRIKYALIADALILFFVAVGCLFYMVWVRNMLGIPDGQGSIFLCQLIGAAVFGLALQNWLVRQVENLEKLRLILLANFVGHGAAFIAFLTLRLNGAGDGTMWLAVGYNLVATLVFGYFLDRPRPEASSSHA